VSNPVIYANEFAGHLNNGLAPDSFKYRILAEGDSWMDRSALVQKAGGRLAAGRQEGAGAVIERAEMRQGPSVFFKGGREAMLKGIIVVLLVAIGLAGCASVPMGDAGRDAQLKSFTPKPGVAGLYIYRNESIGAAIRMDVEVDGKPLGQSAAKTYFYKEVAPGRHTITSKSENTDSIEVDTVAGKLYYIWQEVKLGLLYARTKLTQVGEEEGRKAVLECKLAAGQ
jgi:hypothetical protein